MKELNLYELKNIAGGNIFDWLFGRKKPRSGFEPGGGFGGGGGGSW
ncbi:hypothetical protein [Neisseria dentiae]|nr:hypothetical protein [Neisseria dentiae]QMT45351.1 hypothetical protein H3L92_00370 [Neisseria dentiae]